MARACPSAAEVPDAGARRGGLGRLWPEEFVIDSVWAWVDNCPYRILPHLNHFGTNKFALASRQVEGVPCQTIETTSPN